MFRRIALFLLFCLIVTVPAVAEPGSAAIADARLLLGEMTVAMDSLVKSLEAAKDAASVAASLDTYAGLIGQLTARARQMEEKHGKLENMETNEQISADLEKFQAAAQRFMTAFSAAMEKWGTDPAVIAALTRLNETVGKTE